MNPLKLHEAIAVVLLSKAGRKASIEEIASEVNRRGLYKQRNGNEVPPHQVMMRAKLANAQYHHLFEWIEPDMVRLKNL